MKVYILANPVSGGGHGKQVCKIVHESLSSKDIIHEFFLTNSSGQEEKLVNQILQKLTDEDKFVILGGDGTLSLALNFFPADRSFGFISAGSGNDFARGTDLPRDPLKALDIILTGKAQEFYVMRYQSDHLKGLALNNIGIGLDAAIVKATNESFLKKILNKIKLGQISYFLTALSILFHKKGFQVTTSLRNFENAFLFTLTKHPYFGGGIKIAPEASNQNSDIHLIEVDKIPLRKMPMLIQKILAGTHLSDSAVHHNVLSPSIQKGSTSELEQKVKTSTPLITLSVSPTQPIQIDGETYELSDGVTLQLTTEKRTIIK